MDFRGGQLVLVAGKFIGLIPLNDTAVVEIRPKAKLTDFARILEIAEEEPGALHFFERNYLEKEGIDRLFPLIAKSLVQQLQSIAREGMLKTYRRKEGIFTFKPTIRFSKTAQRLWAHGDFSHSYSEVFEFTKDTPFNRLIKYALWFCGQYIQSEKRGERLRGEVEYFYNLFETVPLDLRLSFLPEVEYALRSASLPVLRQYYIGIAKVCMLVARNRSIILDISTGDVPLLSFIINLEDVFEKYVRNCLRAYAQANRPELSVRNGNAEARGYLFHDSRSFEIKPDIVIARGKEKHIVADTKYKPKTTETDRYQIVSHALALGAKTAVSILPAGAGVAGLVRKGQVFDHHGIQVFEYYLPMENDLADAERQMAVAITGLIPQ